MARKAVATTLSAVLLLTMVVVAAAATMSSEENLATTAQASSLETRESMIANYEAGALTLDDLSQVDRFLSSTPAPCGGLPGYLASISASNSTSGSTGGIAYSASARAFPAPAATADSAATVSALLRPFAGPKPGALNLDVETTVSESASGLVSLALNQTSVVDVPIEADQADSVCASSLSSLESALGRVPPCNSTLAEAAFSSLFPSLESLASGAGFQLTAGWGFAGCAVDYWITLEEPGVAGATGEFEWTVVGSGDAA